MKTKINHALFLFCAIAVLGCKQDKTVTAVHIYHIEGLTLNEGEKWKVNIETHIGMMRMDSILNASTQAKGKTLGKALSEQTSYIIKNCDMRGEPHDQLHVVLVPILEEISELKDTKDSKTKAIKIKRLQFLVRKYFEFFKI